MVYLAREVLGVGAFRDIPVTGGYPYTLSVPPVRPFNNNIFLLHILVAQFDQMQRNAIKAGQCLPSPFAQGGIVGTSRAVLTDRLGGGGEGSTGGVGDGGGPL